MHKSLTAITLSGESHFLKSFKCRRQGTLKMKIKQSKRKKAFVVHGSFYSPTKVLTSLPSKARADRTNPILFICKP